MTYQPFRFRLAENGQSHCAESTVNEAQAANEAKAKKQQAQAAKRLWMRRAGLLKVTDRTHT